MRDPEGIPITEDDFVIAEAAGKIALSVENLSPRIPREKRVRSTQQAVQEPSILERTGAFLSRIDSEFGPSILGVEF